MILLPSLTSRQQKLEKSLPFRVEVLHHTLTWWKSTHLLQYIARDVFDKSLLFFDLMDYLGARRGHCYTFADKKKTSNMHHSIVL